MSGAAPPPAPNQFALLRQRRFLPFFLTQMLGAANDNLFKFALTVLITYQLQLDWLPAAQTGPVVGALFVLPLILFSTPCGQLVDSRDLAWVTRVVKLWEAGVMAVAALGFVTLQVPLLLACVFLMGIHSALTGTLKFAYLPRHLGERELTGGNGVMETGIFVAILLGNVAGALLVGIDRIGPGITGVACVAIALAGWAAARRVPSTPALSPDTRIGWNPLRETAANLRLAQRNRTVFRSILGTSWLWFFGAMFLGNFPAFARNVLHGDEGVASALLIVFLVGIGIGSLLCESLSRRIVEIGLIPLGAIGMSVFSVDLFLTTHAMPEAPLRSIAEFLADPAVPRLLVDLVLLSMFCGLYSVPMYALIQMQADPTHRARIVSANNILNGLFMCASSVVAGLAIHWGVTLPQLFIATGIANLLVATYIFLLVPDYLLRFVAWLIATVMYRVRHEGTGHIPARGAALLVCNQVSYVDALLVLSASPRPVRFLIDRRVFARPVIGPLLRLARAIPLDRTGDGRPHTDAVAAARRALQAGELVATFPEGGMTPDGILRRFESKLIDALPDRVPELPVIPVALAGLWGSYFSLIDGAAMRRPFRRGMFSRVSVRVHAPLTGSAVSAARVRQAIAAMLAEAGGAPRRGDPG